MTLCGIVHNTSATVICSIRRRGYYLSLCGFYSRVAFIKLSVLSKIFVIVRALGKASIIRITKNYDTVTWFWSKPSSLISLRFATKRYLHGTSNPFPHSLPMISHDNCLPCLKNCVLWTVCILVPIVYTLAIWDTRLFMCACATWILAAASIRERRLFRSAHLEVQRQFESSVWSSKYSSYDCHQHSTNGRLYSIEN